MAAIGHSTKAIGSDYRGTATTKSKGHEQLRLQAGGLCRVVNNGHRAGIRCLEGTIWVTQEHDLNDYVLRAGETFLSSNHGLVVVQAVRNASIQIDR